VKLWLARHAATGAAAGTCYGRLDLPALETPTREAAQALAAAVPARIAVTSSPLLRCTALAEALAAMRPDLSVTHDARLAEMDFGDWEGRSWNAIGAQAVQAWTDGFLHHPPGGGEAVAAFLLRVQGAWDETRARGIDTLWITHAGVMRAAHLFNAGRTLRDARDWPDLPIRHGSWQVLDLHA
jgi:alpha-ribazole phosphatase